MHDPNDGGSLGDHLEVVWPRQEVTIEVVTDPAAQRDSWEDDE